MQLQLSSVLRPLGKDAPIEGLQRVLWMNPDQDKVWIIEVPNPKPEAPARRYYKSPKVFSLSELIEAAAHGAISVTSVQAPPLAALTDSQLRELYPKRTGPSKGRRERTDSAQIQIRDKKWNWVRPIIDYVEQFPADAFEGGELQRRIDARAADLGRAPVDIIDAVNRVLAHACGKHGLVSAYYKCGGKGQQREIGLKGHLGRLSEEDSEESPVYPPYPLTRDSKRKIALGYSRMVPKGYSIAESYNWTMGAFWSSGVRTVNGVECPILLPPHCRPSEAQFRYWGPRTDDGKSAFELLMGKDEWSKRFGPMLGSSMNGLQAVGQMGVGDATGSHATMVQMSNPLKAIGPLHRIVIHDGLSDAIVGWYVGLRAPSEETATLAVINAAMDKVEIYKKHGLTITSDQVPACFFRKIRVDNGEARNKGFIEGTVATGGAIEFVQRYKPQSKQQVESGHRSIHRKLDNHISGATRGKPRARGQKHSAIDASWTYFDYMIEFLKAVKFFNCSLDASSLLARHPFRTEMERDGVQPTRAAIHAWLVKHNRVAAPHFDPQLLLARVLPEFDATVKRNGIVLHRPDCGRKVEFIVGPSYTGERARELSWHQDDRPDFRIKVRVDENDLKTIWYVDRLGIHPLYNKSEDKTAVTEGTLADMLGMQTDTAKRRKASRGARQQEQSDFQTSVESRNQQNKRRKDVAIKTAGRKVTKAELKDNIRENRRAEAEQIEAMIDPILRTPIDVEVRVARQTAAPTPSDEGVGPGDVSGVNSICVGGSLVPVAPGIDRKEEESLQAALERVQVAAHQDTATRSLAAFRAQRNAAR